MLKLSKNCFCQKNFVVNENGASFEIFGNSFVEMKSSKSNNYSAETQTDLPLNFGMIHSKKEGLQKDGAIHAETLCLPALDLSKMAPHTNVCVCASTQTCQKWCYARGVGVHIDTDFVKDGL